MIKLFSLSFSEPLLLVAIDCKQTTTQTPRDPNKAQQLTTLQNRFVGRLLLIFSDVPSYFHI